MLLWFGCSVISDSLWPPWTAACQASLSFTISWSLLKLMCIESIMPSSHFILCHSLLLLPSIFASIRVFSKVSSLHQVAKIWELQHQSFQWVERTLSTFHSWFPLLLTDLISLQSKGLSRVFSNTTVQKHQFFSAQLSLWSNSHIHAWLLEKP